ncbi:MAG: hypothetical protein ABSF95_07985 [Verrucomicrobiota bacterium]|jgi:hypothetical protein
MKRSGLSEAIAREEDFAAQGRASMNRKLPRSLRACSAGAAPEPGTITGPSRFSRRLFIKRSATAGLGLASVAGLGLLPKGLGAEESSADGQPLVGRIADAEIRAGVEAAIARNLIPSASEQAYPGHFTITADGNGYGGNTTWPGLDSWQMSGAYLLLGRRRLVLDYFEFVRASQRKDGNVPFAIFAGDTRPDKGCLRGLKYPDDVFAYKPPKREGLPVAAQETRTWIGLFEHWQPKANPLSTLGSICYLLTAAEIFDATGSLAWLRLRLPSLQAAANYLLSRQNDLGLLGGSGFYTELPPRYGSDGVTQCYAIHAFRQLARLCRAVGERTSAGVWSRHAEKLAKTFVAAFWRQDHFAEYIHAEHGLVDAHGLSDVNWAAVAFGIATGRNLKLLWPRLLHEPGFWHGDMPTQTVTKPFTYQPWEHNEPVPFPVQPLQDVAAMGRAWYLEATACQRLQARQRLLDSARKVCRAAKTDGYWRERYHPQPNGTVSPAGVQKYCEYPAVLVRVVFKNPTAFCL